MELLLNEAKVFVTQLGSSGGIQSLSKCSCPWEDELHKETLFSRLEHRFPGHSTGMGTGQQDVYTPGPSA